MNLSKYNSQMFSGVLFRLLEAAVLVSVVVESWMWLLWTSGHTTTHHDFFFILPLRCHSDTFSVWRLCHMRTCKKTISNLVTSVHGKETGVLQEKSSCGNLKSPISIKETAFPVFKLKDSVYCRKSTLSGYLKCFTKGKEMRAYLCKNKSKR